jgi:hypothetical protein
MEKASKDTKATMEPAKTNFQRDEQIPINEKTPSKSFAAKKIKNEPKVSVNPSSGNIPNNRKSSRALGPREDGPETQDSERKDPKDEKG